MKGKKTSKPFMALVIIVCLLSCMVCPAVVMAGEINAAEQMIMDCVEGTFVYEGKNYYAVQGYILMLKEKLEADDVDLTEEQAKTAINYIYANVKTAIDAGYLIEEKENVSQDSVSVSEDSNETQTVTTKEINKIEEYTLSKKLTKKTIVMNVGAKARFSFKKNIKAKKITWKSRDKKIIKVNQKGRITAKKKGKTKIIITYFDGKQKKNYKITIQVKKSSIQNSAVEEDKITEDSSGNSSGANTDGSSDTKENQQTETNTSNSTDSSSSGKEDTNQNSGGTEDDSTEEKDDNCISNQNELKKKINALPEVGEDVLVAGTFVTKNQEGEKITLYFLNKKYSGTMSIKFKTYSFSSDMTVGKALKNLETSGFVGYNSSKTIYVERRFNLETCSYDEWWKVTQVQSGDTYEFKSMVKDTVYKNPGGYGLIIAKGDTTDVITIQ